jgi:hypothetical protein
MPARPIAFLVAVASVLGLAGCDFYCSVGGSIPPEELEKQVRLSYEDETGIVVKSINCEEADDDTGSPISCEATNAGGVDLTIEGEVTSYDSEAEKVRFDWEVTKAVAPGTLYGDAAAMTLADSTGVAIAEVRCPEEIVVKEGARVECTAIAPNGAESGVTLILTDGDGGFRVQLAEPIGAGA